MEVLQLLVKTSVLHNYRLHVVDKSCDGYMFVMLTNKVTGHKIAIHCVYLTPENSVWNNSSELWQSLLTNIYSYCDLDRSVIMGDFNARCGNMTECKHLFRWENKRQISL